MTKLTTALKQMLNGLAAADAGEYLSMTQKFRYLNPGASIAVPSTVEPARPASARKHIALLLGSELPAEIINYVVQTCTRLQHDLIVLTFQSNRDAQALLSPYADVLAKAKIGMELEVLSGDTVSGLARYLRRHAGIAFLACNEAGYLGCGLLSGAQSPKAFPVPVVLVATRSSAKIAGQGSPDQAAARTSVA